MMCFQEKNKTKKKMRANPKKKNMQRARFPLKFSKYPSRSPEVQIECVGGMMGGLETQVRVSDLNFSQLPGETQRKPAEKHKTRLRLIVSTICLQAIVCLPYKPQLGSWYFKISLCDATYPAMPSQQTWKSQCL